MYSTVCVIVGRRPVILNNQGLHHSVVLCSKWTRSFESEEIVPYHFSDINWAQGQNMSHLINCQCINGCLKTLGRKLKLVSCF